MVPLIQTNIIEVRGGYQVFIQLHLTGQAFSVGQWCETQEEAEWYRDRVKAGFEKTIKKIKESR